MKQQLKTLLACIIIISTFCLIPLPGCKVSFLPAYNAQLAGQMDATAKAVDTFYLTMLDTSSTGNNDRTYARFEAQYVAIEAELTSLLNQNTLRPLNANSTRICEITLQLWVKYKEEHKKDNTLTDALIKLNRKTFSDLFFAMQVAENTKNTNYTKRYELHELNRISRKDTNNTN